MAAAHHLTTRPAAAFDATDISVLTQDIEDTEAQPELGATQSQLGFSMRFGRGLDMGRMPTLPPEVLHVIPDEPQAPASPARAPQQDHQAPPQPHDAPTTHAAPPPGQGYGAGMNDGADAQAAQGFDPMAYPGEGAGDGAEDGDGDGYNNDDDNYGQDEEGDSLGDGGDDDEDDDEDDGDDDDGDDRSSGSASTNNQLPYDPALSVVSDISEFNDAALVQMEATESNEIWNDIGAMCKRLKFVLPPHITGTTPINILKHWQRKLQGKCNSQRYADKIIKRMKMGARWVERAGKLAKPWVGSMAGFKSAMLDDIDAIERPLRRIAAQQANINIPQTPMQELTGVLVERTLSYITEHKLGPIINLVTGGEVHDATSHPFETLTPGELIHSAQRERSIHDMADLLPSGDGGAGMNNTPPYQPAPARAAAPAAAPQPPVHDADTDEDSDEEPGPRSRAPSVAMKPLPVQPAASITQAAQSQPQRQRQHQIQPTADTRERINALQQDAEYQRTMRQQFEHMQRMHSEKMEELQSLQLQIQHAQEQLHVLAERRIEEERRNEPAQGGAVTRAASAGATSVAASNDDDEDALAAAFGLQQSLDGGEEEGGESTGDSSPPPVDDVSEMTAQPSMHLVFGDGNST